MSSKPFTARFSSDLVDRLTRRSRHADVSRAKLAERYIDEGLRMDAHPGIVFRDGPAGRRASLAGGPDVWEVIAAVVEQETEGEAAIAAAADWSGKPEAAIRIAVQYYGAYRDEIDSLIAENRRLAEEAETAWGDAVAAIS